MATNRSQEEIKALVEQAVKIDKEINHQLSKEDVDNDFTNIYDEIKDEDAEIAESFASEAASLSAAERVQRIVCALIQQENVNDQTSRQEAKWDLNTAELSFHTAEFELIKEDIDKIRKLADPDEIGTGIRTIQPFGSLGLAILYDLYITKAQILGDDNFPDASDEEQQKALKKFQDTLNELFNNFDAGSGGF
jgi:HPt (histidine-containing phosphotransfer) domain-containing protein